MPVALPDAAAPSPPSSRGGDSPAASLEGDDVAPSDAAVSDAAPTSAASVPRSHLSWLTRHRQHPPERREPPPRAQRPDARVPPRNGAHTTTRTAAAAMSSPELAETAEHTQALRRLVDELSRTQTRQHRLACLTRLSDACGTDRGEDDGDSSRGATTTATAAAAAAELLLRAGAVPALAACLATTPPGDGELVGRTCAGLEQVLRAAAPRSVERAYLNLGVETDPRMIGQDNLQLSPLPLLSQNSLLGKLLEVLDRCDAGTLSHAEATMRCVSRTLMYFAQCPDLRPALLQQEGMLDMLCRTAGDSWSGRQPQESTLFQPLAVPRPLPFVVAPSDTLLECRLLRVQLIAVLASWESNRVPLLEKEGLVDTVARYAHADSSDLVRQFAGKALMELASEPANQAPMAQDDRVLGVLAKMIFVEKGSVVREAVITALQNLAYCKTVRGRLVSFKSGALLEALKHALSTDLDAKARRRAAGALTNLVCAETAHQMGAHEGLLNSLALVCAKDENPEVQTRASLALTKIANCITSEMGCYEALLDALVVASLSSSANGISAVLRVKAREPASREIMARHPGIVDTLSDLCSSHDASNEDKNNAARAILHLSNEPKTRKILCCSTVLDALVGCANLNDPDLAEARNSAIQALERLGTEPSNRAIMARCKGILTALAEAVEKEAECEASGRDTHLAKPLLMSLLVSM